MGAEAEARAFTVTISAPNAPACFSFREDFDQTVSVQIAALLKQTWPMLDFTVDPQGAKQ